MNVNLPLRKLYFSLLSTLGVPVYYMEEPDNNTDNECIVFHAPSNSDASTFTTSDTRTSTQIDIITNEVKTNSGFRVDEIAGMVLNVLKPAPNEHIEGDGIQITSTRIISDSTDNPIMLGSGKFYVRRIIVEHGIFITFNPS